MTTANAAFVALFPGVFFYQSALGLGYIPPALGGYFSVASVAVFPFLGVSYLRRIGRDRSFLTWVDVLFFSFLLYFTSVVALNLTAPRAIVQSHLTAILHFAVVFIIFRTTEFSSSGVRRVLLACLAGMSAIIYYCSVNGIFYLRQSGSAANLETIATYQTFALAYLLTAIVVMAPMRSSAARLMVYGVGVSSLYMNSARSEFLGIVLAGAALELLLARRSPARLLIFGSLAVAVVLAGTAWSSIVQMLPENRVLELLDLGQSTSWSLRKDLLAEALRTIARSPLMGDYASYMPGRYAHNLISAWVDLGLFGFVYLALLVTVPLFVLAADFVALGRKEPPVILLLAFVVGIVTLMLLLTAKMFTYMAIGAAAGAYANYRHARARPEAA